VPDAVFLKLPKKAKRLVALGRIETDTRRDLVRGRLVSNTITGTDKGAMSAKIVGSDRELNLWEPESQILQKPQIALDHKRELLGEDGEVAPTSTRIAPANSSVSKK